MRDLPVGDLTVDIIGSVLDGKHKNYALLMILSYDFNSSQCRPLAVIVYFQDKIMVSTLYGREDVWDN